MSTRVDILAAKQDFEDHVGEHKCRPFQTAVENGQEGCQVRVDLWLKYMDTAGRWGQEATDSKRVSEQYAWQDQLLGKVA